MILAAVRNVYILNSMRRTFQGISVRLENYIFSRLDSNDSTFEDNYDALRLHLMLLIFIAFGMGLMIFHLIAQNFFRAVYQFILIFAYVPGFIFYRYRRARTIYTFIFSLFLLASQIYLVLGLQAFYGLFALTILPATIYFMGRRILAFFALILISGVYYYSFYVLDQFNAGFSFRIEQTMVSFLMISLVLLILVMVLDLTAYTAFRFLAREIRQRKEQGEKLEREHRTKNAIFNILGHDILGPISLVRTLMELGTKQGVCVDEESLQSVSRNTDSAIQLVQNLTEWARQQWSGMKPNFTLVRLNELLGSIKHLLKSSFERKQITLELDLAQDVDLITDAEILRTILRNLISNSLKFTNPGGRVWVEHERTSTGNLIRVHDTGIGIPSHKLAGLFEIKSERVTRGTGKEYGSGLGLMICKDLITHLDGSIDVQSQVDHGSVFYLHLPILSPG